VSLFKTDRFKPGPLRRPKEKPRRVTVPGASSLGRLRVQAAQLGQRFVS